MAHAVRAAAQGRAVTASRVPSPLSCRGLGAWWDSGTWQTGTWRDNGRKPRVDAW